MEASDTPKASFPARLTILLLSGALFLSLTFIVLLWAGAREIINLPPALMQVFTPHDVQKAMAVDAKAIVDMREQLNRIEKAQEESEGTGAVIISQETVKCRPSKEFFRNYEEKIDHYREVGRAGLEIFALSEKIRQGLQYEDVRTPDPLDALGALGGGDDLGQDTLDVHLGYLTKAPPNPEKLRAQWLRLKEEGQDKAAGKSIAATLALVDNLVERGEIALALKTLLQIPEERQEPYKEWIENASEYVALRNSLSELYVRLRAMLEPREELQ